MMIPGCWSITTRAQRCRRNATRFYLNAEGTVVRALCTQHAIPSVREQLLGLRPWEYARVIDRNGDTLYERPS